MPMLLRKARSAVRLAVAPIKAAQLRKEKAPLYTALHSNLDPEVHVKEAADWFCRAQDAGSDRGISYGCVFGEGFLTSYPETTGYIICTLLDLADYYGQPDYIRRAMEAGAWETTVQLPSGSAGIYLPPPSDPKPAVFDTGMVLLGWSALYRRNPSEEIRRATEKACEWLLEIQDPSGHWIKGNDHGYADPRTTLYNVKAAWGLAEAGVALDRKAYIDAAVRNAQYTVSRQLPNGWYQDCCVTDATKPLLHTIAYAMQGLLGIGKITGRKDFIQASARTADSLIQLMDKEGFLPGRIDRNFRGTVPWCCLTGTAQTSIVWSELEAITGNPAYGKAAELANRYLMARHDISSTDPSIRGGLAGSWPVWGDYGQYRILNWATKFLADALLLRMRKPAPQTAR
jgi:hypothetical protein